jgi:acetyl esterase/lipase
MRLCDSSRSAHVEAEHQEALWHELWFANSSIESLPETFSLTPRIHAAAHSKCPPVWVTTGSSDMCIDPAGVPNMVRLMRGYGMEVEWEEVEEMGHSFDFEVGERVEGLRDFLIKHLF